VLEGFTTDLVLLAFCAWGASALIAGRDMPLPLALVLAAVRVSVPVVYFALYFDATWNVGDDLVYAAHGRELLNCGYNPVTVLLHDHGRGYLQSLSQGHHVLYGWWNLLAMSFFGEHYYAPVFLNVVVTFIGGSLLARTVRQLGFSAGYSLGLQIFWLLHWDLIAWSSLLNIKDVLVQTLTIAILYCLVGFVVERKTRFLVGFLMIAQLFWWIRFYVPVIVLTAVMIWMLTQWNDSRKYLFVPLGAMAYYFVAPLISGAKDYWQFNTLFYGTVRFTLTPIPWNVEQVYEYLVIPTSLHWLSFIPAMIGAGFLWGESKYARLFFIYLACLVGLYAITEDLLGPRQRFQVAFLFAWAQFHFAWKMQPAWSDAAMPSAHRESLARAWPATAGRQMVACEGNLP
jgi:hypothetical protein